MELKAWGVAACLLSIQIICILRLRIGLSLPDLFSPLLSLVLAVNRLFHGVFEPCERLLDFSMELWDPDGDSSTDYKVKLVACLPISDHK